MSARNVPKGVNRFKIHINNASQTIDARDVNKLSLALNAAEANVLDLSSESFKTKAFFALENNAEINAMFMDDFENSNFINHFQSIGIQYETEDRQIVVDSKPEFTEGKLISTKYMSQVKGTVQKVILLVDDYIPGGAAINYYVSTNDDDFIPIKKNQSTVMAIKEGPYGIMRADMRKNAAGESPRIYGWTLLYWDKVIAMLFSLKRIDLTGPQLDAEVVGTTVLIRDPLQKDKLVAVVEETMITELFYDEQGRLSDVKETGNGGVFEEELHYGKYIYYDGRENEVLMGTTRTRLPDLIV
jgi:hypothetical protein